MKLVWFLARTILMNQAFSHLKRRGLLVYLRALQAIRRALAGAVILFVTLQLMVFGFIGVLVTGVLLLPQELEMKLWILFAVSFAFAFLPLTLLVIVLSEKTWLKGSGASEMIGKD